MSTSTIRRYLQQRAEAAEIRGDEGIAAGFAAKREGQPITPFPVIFPARAALLAIEGGKYQGLEDVLGATEAELVALKGIGKSTATAIIAKISVELELRGEGKTPLPDNFPAREILVVAGYTTKESLTGYTILDLQKIPDVTDVLAADILAALA